MPDVVAVDRSYTHWLKPIERRECQINCAERRPAPAPRRAAGERAQGRGLFAGRQGDGVLQPVEVVQDIAPFWRLARSVAAGPTCLAQHRGRGRGRAEQGLPIWPRALCRPENQPFLRPNRRRMLVNLSRRLKGRRTRPQAAGKRPCTMVPYGRNGGDDGRACHAPILRWNACLPSSLRECRRDR